MSPRRRFLLNTAIVLAFWLLPLAIYWPVTLGGRTMLPADNLFQWEPWASHADSFGVGTPDNSLLSDMILQNYAWRQFQRESLAQGEIPLWNPHMFGGAPFLATGQNQGYYPFSALFLLLPLAVAYGWYTVSQLWLAGVWMYTFGRILGMRRASAAVAGLIFQGCGFLLVSSAVFPMILGAAIWLPLILGALDMMIRATTHARGAGKTLPWAVLGAFALGMQVLAGHIEITYYTLLVMAAFALWRLVSRLGGREWRQAHGFERIPLWSKRTAEYFVKPVAWLVGTVAIGLLLGAVQFVPFYEVGTSNFREGSATLAEVRGWGFPVRRIITLALPDFFGNPADHAVRDAWTGEWELMTTNYYGQPNPHGAGTTNWGIKNYVEGGIYLGILPLILVVLGVVGVLKKPKGAQKPPKFGGRRSVIAFMVVLSGFSLAFIFGTPLYAILYYGLPGINQLHSPFRWVFPLSLAVAVLAGFGMEYVAQTRMDAEKKVGSNDFSRFEEGGQRGGGAEGKVRSGGFSRYPTVIWVSYLLLGGGVLLLAGLYLSRSFYGALEGRVEQLFLGLALAPDAFPSTWLFYSHLFGQVRHLALMLIGAGAVLLVSRRPWYVPQPLDPIPTNATRLPIWPLLAAVLILFDLWHIGHGFNAAVDPALLEFKPELVQWLEVQPNRDEWRVTTFDNKGQKPLNANAGWLMGFNDIRGYDSIIAKQYVQYMEAIEPQNELPFNRIQPLANWEAINSPLLDLLGVKYIITHEDIDLPKLMTVWQSENLRVYENRAVMPRAYTIPQSATALVDNGRALASMAEIDPRQVVIVEVADWTADPDDRQFIPAIAETNFTYGTPLPAQITASTTREVVVTAEAEVPFWLILNDSYAPGWKVFVRPAGGEDAAEVERSIVRVNHNFRGVQLESGAWEVRFRYSPNSFLLGGLASVMSAITIAFGAAVWAWRRVRPQGELTNTRSIAKNSVLPMGLNLFNRGIDFLFAAFYLRLLGPGDSGAYATAIAMAGLFEILANFGLNAYLIREVSQAKERASSYLLNTTILRLGTGVVGSVPILLYVWLTSYGAETNAAVLYLMVGMVISGIASGFTGLFYAYEEAEVPAAITTLTTIMKVVLGMVILLLGWGFVGLAANSIAVNIITLGIIMGTAVRRYPLRGPWVVDWPLQRRMLVHSYPLMINHLLATVYWQIDVLILREINGETVVGWYNSAYKYVNALNVIPSFFTFALFPIIARQVHSNVADARRTFRMSAKVLTLVSLPLAAVVTFLAPVLIQLLGGEAFMPHGGIALAVIIWSIPFGWLNSVTNYVLISLGQERLQTRAFVLGVSFNVVGNLLLLPRYSYVGAGLTTIASEILLLLVFNYYLVQKMPAVGWLQLLWKQVVVAVGMVGVMWLVAGWLGVGAAVVVGLVFYPLGLWLLRVFGAEEWQIVKAILPARVVGRLG
ncbi:MAG: oligosaccharide flippase family protein [Chloroflexi bacterium]|nr:oligosaccharide flippase family protein [Chloroflexota bacterium]